MAIDVRVVRATPEHAAELARTMRSADVEECWVADRQTPAEALDVCLQTSALSRTLLFDGAVAGMFGAIPKGEFSALGGPSRALVWVLTADVVNAAPLAYVAWSRRILAELLEYCPHLFNYVDERYTGALRWLRWLGFDFTGRAFGPRGHPFLLAELRR